MTIESEINRIKQNIADCYTTLTAKGATIPATENVDNLAACIHTIPTTPPAFVTQSGDTIVTSAGTPLAIDGISSLTTAPSITDTQLTFADDGNSTVSFSMQQLKDYVSPAPAKQGRFVSIGSDAGTGAQAASYSDDGSIWSDLSTFPSTAPLYNWIEFANGKFVALRQSNNTYNLVAYSDDGETWNNATLPTYTLSDTQFISGNDKFVIMLYGTSTSYDSIYYSSDGQNWSSSRIPVVPYTIASGDGKFVVLSNNKSTSSTNLSTWSTASNLPTTLNWNDLAYGGGKWVAIGSGNYPNDNTNSYIYSSDGETWTSNTLPLTMIWQSIAYGNGVFVAFGSSSNYAYSLDGINWYTDTKPNINCYKVWFQGGMFITFLGGTNSSTYYTSTNGTTWTAGTMSASKMWTSIAYGEITPPPPTPSGTTLHQYDRVDNKATVADFWTDGNGQRYAICVADAAYRSGEGMAWGKQISFQYTDTSLPNYSSSSAALAAGESGTYNTDTILNNYTPTDYPAFNFARNALTVTIDNETFESCLPNLKELVMLYQDRSILDTYDTTLNTYPSRSLSIFKCGGVTGCWSSNEYSKNNAWDFDVVNFNPPNESAAEKGGDNGIIPIIEIPVDANGTVITI